MAVEDLKTCMAFSTSPKQGVQLLINSRSFLQKSQKVITLSKSHREAAATVLALKPTTQ